MDTVKQAADRWSVTAQCVRNWIKQGLIKTYKVGPHHLIADTTRPVTKPRGRPVAPAATPD